jgi:eukaryotic-like serine/threonine-protein kinase
VSPELEALISRLLSQAPAERFNGQARQAAEALEQVTQRARPLGARPLFAWGYEHIPCMRSPVSAQRAAQQDAAAREPRERREAEEQTRAATALEQTRRSAFAPAWAAACAMAFLLLVLALVALRWPRGEPQDGARMNSREDTSVSVGDTAVRPAIATPAPVFQGDSVPTLARPLPEKPFPGQRQPPCIPRVETVLRGACWVCVNDMKPPCGNNAYEWEGKCYIPALNPARQPTASPPE